jgi:hypothetical protein
MKRLLALLPLVALAGCVGTPRYAPPPPVSSSATVRAEDFAWSTGEGVNTVTGSVAHRARPGAAPWTCAGGSVGLTPETEYSRRRVSALYGSTRRAVLPAQLVRSRAVEQAAEDYSRYIRSARCDAEGRFTFTGLPDGGWFVIAQAKPAAGTDQQDALAVMQHVETRGGRTVVLKLG